MIIIHIVAYRLHAYLVQKYLVQKVPRTVMRIAHCNLFLFIIILVFAH
jgi:hypothetical protein